jgi:hypothetical protein
MSDLERVLAENGLPRPQTLLRPGKEDIIGISSPTQESLRTWRVLYAQVEQTGFWPVILGGENALSQFRERLDGGDWDVQECLAKAEKLDLEQWFSDNRSGKRHQDEMRRMVDYYKQKGMAVPDFMKSAIERPLRDGKRKPLPNEPWPSLPPRRSFLFQNGGPQCEIGEAKELAIALLPTKEGWRVPAYLIFGGFNACPSPEVHVAVLKHWWHTFGARPVVVAPDEIEALVERPPTTQESAWALAQDQWVYAEFEQFELSNTLKLAAALLGGTTWDFWWD